MILFESGENEKFCCPYCGEKLKFVVYFKKSPDDLIKRILAGSFN